MNDINLDYEIAVELLRETDPEISDAAIQVIWENCNGNPWNSVSIFQILKSTGWIFPK